ncbi:hypothetical protein EAF00_008455 [Botryotinia globosa]|nr:hypothetical protein EAF00_008455 [Botryotinia globosa]
MSSSSEEGAVRESVKRQADGIPELLGVGSRARSGRSKRPAYTRTFPRTGELQKLDVVESPLLSQYANRQIALVPALVIARHFPTYMEHPSMAMWAYTDHKWTSAARPEQYKSRKGLLLPRKLKAQKGWLCTLSASPI